MGWRRSHRSGRSAPVVASPARPPPISSEINRRPQTSRENATRGLEVGNAELDVVQPGDATVAGGVGRGHRPSPSEMLTDLIWVISRSSSMPSSLPTPDALWPPKGMPGW